MATPEEIAASRVFLEKELFERVAVLQELVYDEEDSHVLELAAWFGFLYYFQSAWKMPSSISPMERLRICANVAVKRLLNLRPLLYRSSAFCFAFVVGSVFQIYRYLEYYYTSLIMDSKFRFIVMLEDDKFRRRLIKVYGARGLALARVDDPSEDEELNELARQVAFAGHEEPPEVQLTYQMKFGDGVLALDRLEHDTSGLPCWFNNEDDLQRLIDIRYIK